VSYDLERHAQPIIDDGIEAARLDYPKPGDILKREGSIAGFEACRGKSPAEKIECHAGKRKRFETMDKLDARSL